jgi:hypothetical protein
MKFAIPRERLYNLTGLENLSYFDTDHNLLLSIDSNLETSTLIRSILGFTKSNAMMQFPTEIAIARSTSNYSDIKL